MTCCAHCGARGTISCGCGCLGDRMVAACFCCCGVAVAAVVAFVASAVLVAFFEAVEFAVSIAWGSRWVYFAMRPIGRGFAAVVSSVGR